MVGVNTARDSGQATVRVKSALSRTWSGLSKHAVPWMRPRRVHYARTAIWTCLIREIANFGGVLKLTLRLTSAMDACRGRILI